MGTFFWVLGGVTVLVGAVLVADKQTRHKVIRAIARRWEKGRRQKRRSRARQHVRVQRMAAKNMQQAKPVHHRPRRPRLLATKCSAACRTSRKPAFDPKTGRLLCDCPCGGREHGMFRKGAATGAPRVTTKTPVGTSGTKAVPVTSASPRPSTGAAPKKPAAPKRPTTTKGPTVTNINEGGLVGVQRGSGAPGSRVTNISRGGVVGIQGGSVSGETVVMPGSSQRSSAPKPPRPPKTAAPSLENYGQMVRHTQTSKRCAAGRFSIRTYTDRRTDPPKKRQTVVCGTCSKEL